MLAYTAANAFYRIDVRPFEFDYRTPTVGDLNVSRKDGLWADGANFLTDHTTGIHCPGEATPLVVKCSSGLDGSFSLEWPDPEFFDDRDSRIAPVGQTWLQSVQLSSHQPIFEIMIGVHNPSSPASNKAGCNTLVGQTRIHWSP